MTTTTEQWWHAMEAVLRGGRLVAPESPGAEWKGSLTRELLAYQTTWSMRQPVILDPARRLGFRFMAAEAAWICSGDNRLETIKPFSKQIGRFSDDGLRFFGAYGPRVVDQLSYVTQTLVRDPASRQAVLNVWREQPRESKDTPCTLSLQFVVRGGVLHCVATMRSSDLWTGVPYDVFNFSMIAAMVALDLRDLGQPVTLGTLHLTAGSQHLYERDWPAVEALLAQDAAYSVPPPVELSEFTSSSHLVACLWTGAREGHDVPFMEGML